MPTAPSTVRIHERQPTRRRNHDMRLHYMREAWRQMRVTYLSEHPLCVACEANGLVEAAVDVDHIRPHEGSLELFYDPTNLQGLCKRCHAIKTRRGQ